MHKFLRRISLVIMIIFMIISLYFLSNLFIYGIEIPSFYHKYGLIVLGLIIVLGWLGMYRITFKFTSKKPKNEVTSD